MKKNWNRKGLLLGEETLKIIVALICIVFLIYLLASLYYNSVRDKDMDLAKSSAEYIADEINSGATEILVYNPEGWAIVRWDGGYLCICKSPSGCDPDDTCAKLNADISVNGIAGENWIAISEPPVILELNDGVLSRKWN
jgi:hypothetical protein